MLRTALEILHIAAPPPASRDKSDAWSKLCHPATRER